ncbi:MAG: methyltransferase domain-containing protein [Acidimicrobiales bacterium]|nr:methyltransferase domain-containing protein [Acidimicrobiales bacterium]
MSLRSGDRVLDLACGTGLVARPTWRDVGPGGWVVGADVKPAMLAVASTIEPAIEWLRAGADTLPFEPEVFTHVACQQGLRPGFGAPPVRVRHRCPGPPGSNIWRIP